MVTPDSFPMAAASDDHRLPNDRSSYEKPGQMPEHEKSAPAGRKRRRGKGEAMLR